MRSVYEEERIPLQIRRLMIFNKICRKARKYPNEVVPLTPESQLAFGVIYLQEHKRYLAFGGVFEYAHTRKEVIEQGVHKLAHNEFIMCAITIKRQAFTTAVRTPIELLWHWNSYIRNRRYKCLDNNVKHFFPVNDELEIDYPPHKYHHRLVAIKNLPLWNIEKILSASTYNEKRSV